jgi:hypothetical protein
VRFDCRRRPGAKEAQDRGDAANDNLVVKYWQMLMSFIKESSQTLAGGDLRKENDKKKPKQSHKTASAHNH